MSRVNCRLVRHVHKKSAGDCAGDLVENCATEVELETLESVRVAGGVSKTATVLKSAQQKTKIKIESKKQVRNQARSCTKYRARRVEREYVEVEEDEGCPAKSL